VSAVARPTRTATVPDSPYVGLTSYTQDDAQIFFGRDSERKVLIANLRASRMTLLYARSGTGKSSLLRAGVAARLQELARRHLAERGTVRNVPIILSSWHDEPTNELINAVQSAIAELLPEVGPINLPRTGLVDALEAGSAIADATLLVILDQFEEYLLATPSEARPGRFADELAACLNRTDLQANFLIAVREDAYSGIGDLFKHRVENVYGNYLHLADLDRTSAREAIMRPIERVNELHPEHAAIEIEPALVSAVLQQLSRPEDVALDPSDTGVIVHGDGSDMSGEIAAPYLQLVMKRLWDTELERRASEDEPVRLRLETLTELGGAGTIVTTHVDRALGDLSGDDRDAAVDIFRHLVTRSGTKIALAAPDLADYTHQSDDEIQELLERLTRADVRILHDVPPSPGAEAPRFEISHDLLAPPILDWCTRVMQERSEAQVADEMRRRHRRMLIGAGALLALVAVFATLSIWALIERGNAEDAARHATWLAVASTAKDLADSRVGDSLLLGLAGIENDPTTAARSAMTSALEQAEASGARTVLIGHTGPVLSIDGSSDGVVASGGQDGTVRLWNVARGREIGDPMTGHVGAVRAVAFSPDGQTIASGGDDKFVRLWARASRKPIVSPIRLNDAAIGIAFSPDGTLLAVASKKGQVYIIDRQAPSQPHVLHTGEDADLTAVAFSPDGRTLAAASQDGQVFLWPASDVESNPAPLPSSLAGSITGDKGAILAVAFDPSGHKIATGGGDNVVRMWDRDTSTQLWEHRVPAAVTDVAFSPDGRTLATTDGDGVLRLWNAQTGKAGPAFTGHVGHASGVVFSPDGRTLTTAGFDGTLRVWERAHQPALGRVVSGKGRTDVNGVAYAPDGTLASVDEDGNLRLLAQPGPTLRWKTTADGEELHGVARSRTGEIAAAGDGGDVRVWDETNPTQPSTLKAPGSSVLSVAFSRDGRRIAGGSEDGTLRIWRTVTDQAVPTQVRVSEAAVNGVAFSPLGHVLATASADGRVRLWDVADGSLLATSVPRGARMGIAFSPDGAMIAAAGADGTIRLLDAGTLEQQGAALVGHAGSVFAVAFSPDGQTLASAGFDGSVRLWDPESHTELGDPLFGHEGRVLSVAFSPDGTTLASSGDDGTVRTWSGVLWRSQRALAERVCRLVSRDLTAGEWNSLVPDAPYHRPCAEAS
jgi:WD40 repeat protein